MHIYKQNMTNKFSIAVTVDNGCVICSVIITEYGENSVCSVYNI